jgi:hypothetical protein
MFRKTFVNPSIVAGSVGKSGTKDAKHIVSTKSNGSGSVYDLVYVEANGSLSSK